MTKKFDNSDRRSFERFATMGETETCLPPHCPGIGPVIDISMGGLAFIHDGPGQPHHNLSSIDIFFGNDICCLKDIPCRIVHYGNVHGDQNKKYGRVQFGELSQKQKAQLEYLLKINARPKNQDS